MKRCDWVGHDKPHYEHYHDTEWGIPVHDDCKHFEMLILNCMTSAFARPIRSMTHKGHGSDFLSIY
jgi:3-methyladenine DNA glycosylase Tag